VRQLRDPGPNCRGQLSPRRRPAVLGIQYRTLPAGQYPNTAAIAHALPALDDPGNFTTAVDLMIEAIRARAANPQDPSTPPGIRG